MSGAATDAPAAPAPAAGTDAPPKAETRIVVMGDSDFAANAGLEWIRNGRAFVLLSEKGGWRQAYVHSRDGAPPRLLTPGPSDVIARGRAAETQGYFYYLASPENATQRYLYRVRLDGTSAPERVSPQSEPGTHSYEFSPDGRFALH